MAQNDWLTKTHAINDNALNTGRGVAIPKPLKVGSGTLPNELSFTEWNFAVNSPTYHEAKLLKGGEGTDSGGG